MFGMRHHMLPINNGQIHQLSHMFGMQHHMLPTNNDQAHHRLDMFGIVSKIIFIPNLMVICHEYRMHRFDFSSSETIDAVQSVWNHIPHQNSGPPPSNYPPPSSGNYPPHQVLKETIHLHQALLATIPLHQALKETILHRRLHTRHPEDLLVVVVELELVCWLDSLVEVNKLKQLAFFSVTFLNNGQRKFNIHLNIFFLHTMGSSIGECSWFRQRHWV